VIVTQALAAARRALSAQELYERIKPSHPTLGRATVYRALEAQVQDGIASRFEREGHVSAYVACDAQHHHHLVCDECGLVMPFSDAALERAIGELSAKVPLKVSEHEIVLHGACRDCAG